VALLRQGGWTRWPTEVLPTSTILWFSFGWALAFLSPYPQVHIAPLYFSQITHPCFCLPYVSFLYLGFVRSSLVSLCLFYCLSWRWWYLKNQQAYFDCSSLQDHTPWDSSKRISKPAKDRSPEGQGYDPAFCFFPSS